MPARAQAAYDQLANLSAAKARARIVELLRESGDLIGEPRPITHPVKFYEKGDRPLEIVTSRQWFIKTMEFREALLASGRSVHLTLHYHWQFSFVITGASGFVLLGVWLWFYQSPERQPWLSAAERKVILHGNRSNTVAQENISHPSAVVPARCPQFLFHTFPHGSFYVFFPFLASRLSPNLARFLSSKDRHDGFDSFCGGRSRRFDRWGCLRLAGSSWNGSAPGPPAHSVGGGVSFR